ncbi:venom serine protease Bi-VSP-like isoform X2 [Contarinia nasturtii]|uniref:venom serine protease Bi-VSP-like isoform X2 n=1 Tax=Contarinia nasturtii TaxID=265458 RepID=UPI0012D373F5|nr:venom serine protease Bi-VSP-like isoform X2 [Contarinia nasturtii]
MGNHYLFGAVNFILIIAQISTINAQGEQCFTPNNSYGICVVLPQCPSIVNYYGQNQGNPQVINYLLASQRNCGTRSIRRNPLVCCGDPVINRPQEPQPQPSTPQPQTFNPQPDIPEVSTAPNTTPRTTQTTTSTTQRTTTQFPIPDSSRSSGESCRDPNGIEGVCMSIKECPVILNEFVAKSKDSSYVQYIKRSNENCRNIQPYICCPSENKPIIQTDASPVAQIQGRLLTADEGCGYTNDTTTRVVGGRPAKNGQYGWMALLGYVNNLGEQSWKCGGSLITSRHVLTAAHCILSTLSNVRLGEHDISSTSDGEVQDIKVIRSERHADYNRRDGTNDIAILYLERDVQFSKRIRPVCLPVEEPIRSRSFVGWMPFVAGWGRLQEGGKSSNILQHLQLPILPNDECQAQYQKQGKLISQQQFGDAVLCAGILEGRFRRSVDAARTTQRKRIPILSNRDCIVWYRMCTDQHTRCLFPRSTLYRLDSREN